MITATTETETPYTTGDDMSEGIGSLPEIPDLSGVTGSAGDVGEPLADGWYRGTILAKRAFTDTKGNDLVFESNDEPALKSGRNIRLQVQITRQSDGKTVNIGYLLNYRPEDLTQTRIQQVLQEQKKVKEERRKWENNLFRSFMSLKSLSDLQKVAGVRSFQRTSSGGLDVSVLFDKQAYFRLEEDDRNAKYKEIADISIDLPKRVL